MELKTLSLPFDSRKPGRGLIQFDLEKIAEFMGLSRDQIRYPYHVVMTEGNPAGNHYHHKKEEVIGVTLGTAIAALEHPETKERVEVTLSHDPATGYSQAIRIPLGVAHVIIPTSLPCVLTVWATHPAREPEDDFAYPVTQA